MWLDGWPACYRETPHWWTLVDPPLWSALYPGTNHNLHPGHHDQFAPSWGCRVIQPLSQTHLPEANRAREKQNCKRMECFLSNIRNCIWYAFGILCVVAVLKMSVDLSWQRKKDRDKWQRSQMCGYKIKSVLFGSLPLMLAKFKLCMSLLLYAFS